MKMETIIKAGSTDSYERKVSRVFTHQPKVYLKEQTMSLYKKAIELATRTKSSVYVTIISEEKTEYATFLSDVPGSQGSHSRVQEFGPTSGGGSADDNYTFQKWMERNAAGLADWGIVTAKQDDGSLQKSEQTDEGTLSHDHSKNHHSLTKVTKLL